MIIGVFPVVFFVIRNVFRNQRVGGDPAGRQIIALAAVIHPQKGKLEGLTHFIDTIEVEDMTAVVEIIKPFAFVQFVIVSLVPR